MIKAEIIADSINPNGNRLTTFVLTYPRFIHSEFMTHRMISKNSASSRAIPSAKIIQDILDNPAMPEWWGKNQSGMQAEEELDEGGKFTARRDWLHARNQMIEKVQLFQKLGLHKQIANRVLEPWFHMRVIASATEWTNFFALRCHPKAQPEIQALADAMLFQYVKGSTPRKCEWGDWHLPFADKNIPPHPDRKTGDLLLRPVDELVKISTARCARVSYLNFEGNSDFEKDIELHDKLVSQTPGHFSPTEHPASASPEGSGNFKGWKQYRCIFQNQNITNLDLNKLLADRAAAGSKYAKGEQ